MKHTVDFLEPENAFLLRGEDGSEIVVPYTLNVHRDTDSYKVFRFFKRGVLNEDIYEVYDANKQSRIGWIFPIAALASDAHTQASNKHFLTFAFPAISILLQESDFDLLKDLSETEIINLDFFPEDLVILCLSHQDLTRAMGADFIFNIESYLPSLYRKGFTLQPTSNTLALADSPKTSDKKMRIRPVQSALMSDKYVTKLFTELIFDSHPLAKFHMLYQMVELTMDRILLISLENLTARVKDKQVYGREIRESFEKVEAEKKRIIMLFDQYFKPHSTPITANLTAKCNAFLNAVGRLPANSLPFGELLYLVRNVVIHDYRSTTGAGNELVSLNEAFEQFACEMAIGYCE